MHVLVINDEPALLAVIGESLRANGHRVVLERDGLCAQALLDAQAFDLLICDMRLLGANGMSVAEHARRCTPDTEMICMTAYVAVGDVVAACKSGAADFLAKPVGLDALHACVDQIAALRAVRAQFVQAQVALATQAAAGTAVAGRSRANGERAGDVEEPRGDGPPRAVGMPDDSDAVSCYEDPDIGPIVGTSSCFRRALAHAVRFAAHDYAVLVSGESGTGKELVAKMLHRHSERAHGPFVTINCAAFPEGLLEAELFGYRRGAFTGAFHHRDGRFKAAHRGTLFLDEVAEMSLPAQAKLLRVLQDGCFEPLGTNEATHVDVRIVSATHRDLRARARQGLFREDLYYRLKVLSIELPPLRERHGDLPLLATYFLRRCMPSRALQKEDRPHKARLPTFSVAAMAALMAYPFPGNVRELEHAIQQAAVLANGGPIDVQCLPPEIGGSATKPRLPGDVVLPLLGAAVELPPAPLAELVLQPLGAALHGFEREYLMRALLMTRGKRGRAAELLHITRKSLWQKLRRRGLLDFIPPPAVAIEGPRYDA